jgi:hypothetical protein
MISSLSDEGEARWYEKGAKPILVEGHIKEKSRDSPARKRSCCSWIPVRNTETSAGISWRRRPMRPLSGDDAVHAAEVKE